MKLEKAIETLRQDLNERLICYPDELREAKKLGIEALKRVIVNRQPIRAHWREPLPGETEEKGEHVR